MFSPNQHAVNGSVPAVRLPTYRSRHGPSAQSRCFPGRWRATTNCSSYAARIHVPSLTLMMRSARSSHSIASVTAAPNTRPAWQQRSPPTGHNGPRRPWKRPRREEVCTWIPIELFADEHKLILHARICILRCPQLRIAVSVVANNPELGSANTNTVRSTLGPVSASRVRLHVTMLATQRAFAPEGYTRQTADVSVSLTLLCTGQATAPTNQRLFTVAPVSFCQLRRYRFIVRDSTD